MMDIATKSTRHIRIGDVAVSCSSLEQELVGEINKLKSHIALLQRTGTSQPSELEHLRELLVYRKAVLDWLRADVDL